MLLVSLEDFFDELFLADFFAGTFAPAFRASESPIAMACFGFVTFRPEPLFSLPSLKACISRSTLADAFGPYFLPLLFLLLLFFVLLVFALLFVGLLFLALLFFVLAVFFPVELLLLPDFLEPDPPLAVLLDELSAMCCLLLSNRIGGQNIRPFLCILLHLGSSVGVCGCKSYQSVRQVRVSQAALRAAGNLPWATKKQQGPRLARPLLFRISSQADHAGEGRSPP